MMHGDMTQEKQSTSPPTEFKGVVNLKGSLKKVRLADIFLGLQRDLKTGVLHIKSDAIIKKVYINHGDVIFAVSNIKEDRLGEFLVRQGRITPEEHSKADKLLVEKKGRLGRILVDLGYLTPHDILQSVQRQVEEIILSLFSIEDGEYEFQEGPLPSEELIKLRISTANVIYRGIKQISSRQYIDEVSPSPNTLLNVSQDPRTIFQHVDLDESDREILSYIDGSNSIKTIMSLSTLDSFETLKTLYALLNMGIIEAGGEVEEIAEEKAEETVVHPVHEEISEPSAVVSKGFMRRIEDMYVRLERIGYYELLGVKKDATAGEIKKSAYSILKEFHPDRRFSLPSDNIIIKKKLTSIQSSIIKAYQTLHDPLRRREYDSMRKGAAAERTIKFAAAIAVVLVCTVIIFFAVSGKKEKGQRPLPDVKEAGRTEQFKAQRPQISKPSTVSGSAQYSVKIEPRAAFRGSVFRLVPGNFRLSDAEIQWFMDEQAVNDAVDTHFMPENIRKGSTVQAQVVYGGEQILSDIVVVRNSPPAISNARILPEAETPGALFVEVVGADTDGDDYTTLYEWTRNGEPAGDGKYIESPLKRGDRVAVKVSLYDEEDRSEPVVLQREILNMPPMIAVEDIFHFDGKLYTHRVTAEDPDGDTLTYSLKSASEGIAIDPETGVIRWNVPRDFIGKVPVTVSVADGHGGEGTRDIMLTINTPPEEE
jgi:curved DNA-binding protein CbpA